MTQPVHEGDLAWDLAERYRHQLDDHERNTVFVLLGVGDHPVAIRLVLEALARERVRLPTDLVTQLDAWAAAYARTVEFAGLLARVAGESDEDQLTA